MPSRIYSLSIIPIMNKIKLRRFFYFALFFSAPFLLAEEAAPTADKTAEVPAETAPPATELSEEELYDMLGCRKKYFKPPAALEGTENTEEKMNLIRHCGSVSSVLSNDRLVRAYPASAGEAPREWVVKKEPTRRGKKHSTNLPRPTTVWKLHPVGAGQPILRASNSTTLTNTKSSSWVPVLHVQ